MRKIIVALCLAGLAAGCNGSGKRPELTGAVSGTVDIAAHLAGGLTGAERVFVVARTVDGEPVAVQPVTGLDFPLNFCLSSANVLTATLPLPEKVLLSALVTVSDDPFDGGLRGMVRQPVSLGSQNIRIQVVEEAAAPAATFSIEGTVVLAGPLEGGAKPTDVLYLIVRTPDGRLLAVSEPYERPRFPLKYHLTNDNVMMGRISGNQDMVVIGRLDRDGNAFSSSGDVEGECKRRPVRAGDRNVDIVLDAPVP